MRVRKIDLNGDWTFGQSNSNYCADTISLAQNIKTRLQCFLGDAFSDLTLGIDWWLLLGGKNQLAAELAISTTILNTEGVTGLREISANLDARSRALSVQYEVNTIYGTVADEFSFDANPIG